MMPFMPRIALVQMTATNNLEKNLSQMLKFVEFAHHKRADIMAFPELAYFRGTTEEWAPLLPRYEGFLKQFGEWARHNSLELLPGSLREGIGARRFYNSLPYFNTKGEYISQYRKIHLFEAHLREGVCSESRHVEAGKETVVIDRPWGKAGLAICFDIRFPELFRSLKKQGAHVVFLPSAFTAPTGQAHWKALLKCRAIENQIFIVAPALTGESGDGQRTYGHSMIVSPWGEILAEMGEEQDICFYDIDLTNIEEARRQIDVWSLRREDLFPTPG